MQWPFKYKHTNSVKKKEYAHNLAWKTRQTLAAANIFDWQVCLVSHQLLDGDFETLLSLWRAFWSDLAR